VHADGLSGALFHLHKITTSEQYATEEYNNDREVGE